eukprot:1797567-Amphidinium_carterae.1
MSNQSLSPATTCAVMREATVIDAALSMEHVLANHFEVLHRPCGPTSHCLQRRCQDKLQPPPMADRTSLCVWLFKSEFV